MLRVETEELGDSLTFKLQGRFTGEGAEQVRTLVTRSQPEMKLIIDLAEVMYIDAVGEGVLSFFKKLGAQFVSETAYSRNICERLDLPLAQ
ncbi:MAG TPA: STAS domain-containing protein [Terriglobales bacterium]|nr:STAS domain-containing protein [Terriglobales bacterium]